eukprot:TRINITY_DN776147_c0_g1_i1.p1 TRINITY_DN776147_c0_g1~~TRINITY_DN776147_c0_g1_i1.p1  ORF type:complete len:341 (+),score=42.38 TRINITY_DN776147_c0_g1_i1:66-1088(+)
MEKEVVNLESRDLRNIEEGLAVIDELKEKESIHTLNLANTGINSQFIDILTEIIPQLKDLEELYLTNATIGKHGAKSLNMILNNCPKLTDLGLKHCGLRGCVNMLEEGLLSCQKLEAIDLEGNGLIASDTSTLGRLMESESNNIRRMNLCTNNMSVHVTGLLNGLSSKNCKIQSIDLSWNFMGATNGGRICSALPKSIQRVNLRGNRIGVEGAKCLSKVLPDLRTLFWVDIRDNHLSSKGIIHLAKASKLSNSLQRLDMRGNELTHEGYVKVPEILNINDDQKPPTEDKLKLKYPLIDDMEIEYDATICSIAAATKIEKVRKPVVRKSSVVTNMEEVVLY